ncbi:zinc finger protein 280C-like [Diretmus argenteus]
MSELFMECEEEELQPWQKQVPEVNLVDDDDDDEPIFVGELTKDERNRKPYPTPLQRNDAGRQEIQSPAAQPARGSAQIVLPQTIPEKGVNTAPPSLTTMTPQPVIVNNQGFIVTSPQILNNTDFIASLGKQYPPGTSFTIVPAGHQHLLQQVNPTTLIPGVVHRPQVQQINNNVVTLSNVQCPTVYSMSSNQLQPNRSNSQSVQLLSLPVMAQSSNKDQSSVKRGLPPQQNDSLAKRAKVGPSLGKHVMLVSDFYYGRFEGEKHKHQPLKTNVTFKCQSCLKVLKNNIRFMNHMKHHLELEKQNSESWESHTTCQHCYRQYMTPFHLQCHIESAHSPFESSTNCKICELAFESEQVLLEHMKDNHKPGEMPYVCQVCNYRSSFFSEVEAHFRSVHDNTKDLLCPFCLKVLKSSHSYMQHYMKHQKKRIQRCTKCRLNFLTYKEKLDHMTHSHKTFRKPKALEGLPPGTKVTIRASLTGKMPAFNSPDRSTLTLSPETASFKQPTKVQSNIPKVNIMTPDMFGLGLGMLSGGVGKAKAPQSRKRQRLSKHNLALRNLRVHGGRYTCIECNTRVDDFFSHYPMISNCGACKYSTSCKVSISNHMIRFHSVITKDRFRKMENRKKTTVLNVSLVCLNCDLLVDASSGDVMSKHLVERPTHTCKVLQDKADVKEQAARRRNWAQSQQQRAMSQFQRQEEQREQQTKRINRDKQVQAGLMTEERVEKKRHLREVQDEFRERQIEDALLKAEEERIDREKQLEQEERMAKELARINYEKQRDEKMRQYIKENSIELRELESKLKSAYLNREIAAQIAEKEVMTFETMRQEADYARKMKSELERAAIEQQKLEQRHHEESLQYQKQLEQQLAERELKRQEAYEEFLKEKLMVDEIVKKIYEEDQIERQLKLEKERATRQYIDEFKRQQAEWRAMEQAKMEAETRRIEEFASQQQQMEENKMAKIREREQAKEHLHKMLSEKMEMERRQREEMERAREDLCLEEQAEAIRQREIEEMEKKIRQRLMLQQTCEEQMAFKNMRKQAEKEEEEAFRRMTMAKFAEDDRIEQMNAQKRRMKQLEHKRAVEKLIEDRRRQHEADMELEAKERAVEQEREALRRRIIEEERRRLLTHHATKLLGYLPKGLLREDDLDHFDEDFRRNFQKRQADIFSEEGWESD